MPHLDILAQGHPTEMVARFMGHHIHCSSFREDKAKMAGDILGRPGPCDPGAGGDADECTAQATKAATDAEVNKPMDMQDSDSSMFDEYTLGPVVALLKQADDLRKSATRQRKFAAFLSVDKAPTEAAETKSLRRLLLR
mmetsp:Transcript_123891/g.219550  ORF Transcript_123891/g.219550 Transcript_123891/m.219550 type:complete len:139 (+) Transcript_123891:70-486(+)